MIVNIQEKIDQATKGLKQPARGDKMLEVVLPYTTEFLEIFPQREIPLIMENSFFHWFSQQKNIIKAYQLLADKNLLTREDNGTVMTIILEFVTANSIHFLIGSKIIYGNKKTRRAIVPKKKQMDDVTRALKILKQKINLHQGIYCKHESKQYLLNALIEDILLDQADNQRSIYSSGTMKPQVIREIFIKRLIHGLLSCFDRKKSAPASRLIAQIALEISAIFYPSMDISDATDLTTGIKENLREDEKFRQQAIFDYLDTSLQKGAKQHKKR